jgi:hypothetical protein
MTLQLSASIYTTQLINGRGVIDTNTYCHTHHTLGLGPLALKPRHHTNRAYETALRAAIAERIAQGIIPANFNGLWCIDYEHYSAIGPRATAIWGVLLRVVRELFPGARVTAYAKPNNWKYQAPPIQDWLHNDAQAPVLRKLDCLGPDMYLPNPFIADWKKHAKIALAECRRIAPKVPIRPWFSPSFMPNPGGAYDDKPIPASLLADCLVFLEQEGCEGAHIWEAPRDGSPMTGPQLQTWIDELVTVLGPAVPVVPKVEVA